MKDTVVKPIIIYSKKITDDIPKDKLLLELIACLAITYLKLRVLKMC